MMKKREGIKRAGTDVAVTFWGKKEEWVKGEVFPTYVSSPNMHLTNICTKKKKKKKTLCNKFPSCMWGKGPIILDFIYATLSCISVKGCFNYINVWLFGHMTTTLGHNFLLHPIFALNQVNLILETYCFDDNLSKVNYS